MCVGFFGFLFSSADARYFIKNMRQNGFCLGILFMYFTWGFCLCFAFCARLDFVFLVGWDANFASLDCRFCFFWDFISLGFYFSALVEIWILQAFCNFSIVITEETALCERSEAIYNKEKQGGCFYVESKFVNLAFMDCFAGKPARNDRKARF
ncbi:hypothetical protein BKN38_06955 [Helicobacter sp. CLO-3]|nr:hypothetical protein BA723_01710 [Helicobacter sp. CLO-3]OHU82507.1 hypothetical protein BKN38_06955 [Helicobacter sp. CLO-3]